ncbi:uncharacterized protein [Narcine bancroftii]|uniref:uncharacterized protein n=1 Tax=Narcine bancroftii TaxID=1343680 RepID=UPI003831B05E
MGSGASPARSQLGQAKGEQEPVGSRAAEGQPPGLRHQVACWGLADQLKVVGLRSRENASQPAGPTDGIAAQACSQLAWLILNCDSLDQASKQLEASLQWLDLRKAGLLDMEQTRASLLLCKAVFCLTRLSQQHQCRLARIFSPVWGWSSNSAVWARLKSVESQRRRLDLTGLCPELGLAGLCPELGLAELCPELGLAGLCPELGPSSESWRTSPAPRPGCNPKPPPLSVPAPAPETL